MKNKTWLLIGGALLLIWSTTLEIWPTNRRLSILELWTLAKGAGFVGVDLIIAIAIALAESGGNPYALGDKDIPTVGSASYGLWQINSYFHPEFGPDWETLFDPHVNAAAAFSVYRAAGNSFTPWTTFKSGAYMTFMNQVKGELNG